MLNTSKDVLFITISASVGLLTIFTCWALYYLVQMLKQTNALVSDTRKKIDEFFEILEALKEKLSSSVSYLGVITEAVGQLVRYFGMSRGGKGEKKK